MLVKYVICTRNEMNQDHKTRSNRVSERENSVADPDLQISRGEVIQTLR